MLCRCHSLFKPNAREEGLRQTRYLWVVGNETCLDLVTTKAQALPIHMLLLINYRTDHTSSTKITNLIDKVASLLISL